MDFDSSPVLDRIVDWVKRAAPALSFRIPDFFLRRRERSQQQKHIDAALDHQSRQLTAELRESITTLEGRLKKSNDALEQMRVDHERAMHEDRLDLERTVHRENIELQRELERKRSELEAYLAAYRRESALREIQAGIALGANNPLRATVENILRQQTDPEQLIVILAPYQISDNLPHNISVPESQQYISNEIDSFIARYDSNRVRLLSGAWKDNSYHGATAAGEVFGLLQSEPVLIIESHIENDKLTLQAWFWGRNWDRQNNIKLLSNFPFITVLHRIASRHAHEWRHECTERCGVNTSAFETAFLSRPEDARNWEELAQQDNSNGAYVPNLTITNRHWDDFYLILSTWHSLAVGALADAYFLTQYNASPLLPALFPHLLTRITDATSRTALTDHFLLAYHDLLVAYRHERPREYPILAVNIATAFAALQERAPALDCAHDAVTTWLRLWGEEYSVPWNAKKNTAQFLEIPSDAFTAIQQRDPDFARLIDMFPLHRIQCHDNYVPADTSEDGVAEQVLHVEVEPPTLGTDEFAHVSTMVRAFEELRERMNAHVDDINLQEEANRLGSDLQKAFAILEQGLRAPKISIAITGGTNSGKSTLINLLAGAELAPVEYCEMTAGLTTFRQHPSRRLFVIEDTPDPNTPRIWQPGHHNDLSDAEMQAKSKDLMDKYNDIRKEHISHRKYGDARPSKELPHPPKLVIHHPNILDCLPADVLNLPTAVDIELIDLPGVIDPGDQDNIALTRGVAASNGICIIVCDVSILTGSDINDKLITEAVNSLKLLGSTQNFALLAPRRILFLFNKVDILFSKDAPVQKIIDGVKSQILAKLIQEIPEIRPWHTHFVFLPMSGGLAHFHDILKRTPLDQRAKHINAQRNEDFLNKRNVAKIFYAMGGFEEAERWNNEQWERLLSALEDEKQRYEPADLVDVLTAHIREHFPALVLPQLFNPVLTIHAKEVCTWARLTVTAKNNQNKKDCDTRIRQLEALKDELHDVTQQQARKLDPINEFADNIADGVERFRERLQKSDDIAEDVAQFTRDVRTWSNKVSVDFIPSQTLQALFSWIYEIRRDIEGFLNATGKALAEHSSKIDEANKHRLLSVKAQNDIRDTIESLVDNGYRRMLRDAKGERYINTQDMALAKRIEKLLGEFTEHVTQGLQEILLNRLKLEANRLVSLMNTINDAYSEALLQKVDTCTAQYQLSDLNFLLDIPIRPLDEDFIVDEKLDTVKVKDETKTKYEIKYVKRQETRTSWIGKMWGKVQDWAVGPKPVEIEVNYKVGKIPTAGMLMDVWSSKGGVFLAVTAKQLSSRLNDRIQELAKELGDAQQQVLIDNIELIEKEAKKVATLHEREGDFWDQATLLVEKMENEIKQAQNMLRDRLKYSPDGGGQEAA